jgi:hypothetical protein
MPQDQKLLGTLPGTAAPVALIVVPVACSATVPVTDRVGGDGLHGSAISQV